MNDSNKMFLLDKNEMKEISGKGVVIEYYIEDGILKQRLVYVADK